MYNSDRKTLSFAYKRMIIGSILGGALFFLLFWIYAYFTKFTPGYLNPYVATFPWMASFIFAWLGIVIGALMSLLSGKTKNINSN